MKLAQTNKKPQYKTPYTLEISVLNAALNFVEQSNTSLMKCFNDSPQPPINHNSGLWTFLIIS